ncbi:peptidylprolyl isomerase fpr3 [Cladophialophora chaetospira]|uniref:peptidylprolyl isomerase n=1 Tax=Cladophialophora chaetospira TaxID=386627 RepID=A0AA38X1W6_9EURO|nr:peptidylprolyl isomerase fpr3 [Cladophialophora chaetospira]
MSGIQPVAVYAMRVPPGDIMVPAVPEFAAMFRLTMAAIDPSAEPELEDPEDKRPPRATLKLVRVPDEMFDDDDSDDEDFNLEDIEDDEDDDDEEVNGGPSEKKSKIKAEDDDEDMEDEEDEEDDDEEDAEAMAQLARVMKSVKGKAKALDGEADADDEDDSDDESLEMDEVVICTLDPEKNYQQTLDFVVGEGEKVFFKVSGTHTIHLTGNYVIPQDDGSASLYDEDDEEEEYDLSPDEDELAALEDADEESDALDDLADPRIAEVDSEEEPPKLIKDAGKGKNKRPAEADEDEEENLDDIVAKSLKKEDVKPEPTSAITNGESLKKLSKAERKRLKKLKKNDGEAVAVDAGTPEVKKEAAQTNGDSEKKVQFAKNLVQGPTPSATPPVKSESKTGADGKEKKASLGVKDVQGVTIDDRKLGNGPAAKKGSRLEMRYIGKLESGSVFDSNKSGKPFSFKLGAGEVIKGWDVGLQGIQVGGERRLIIPAHLAYGNKAMPGIPKNSKLTFDIKCVAVK